MSSALAARNRFGLGARATEAARLDDPRGWLLEQLDGTPPGLAGDPPSAAARAEVERTLAEAMRAGDDAAQRRARRGIAAVAGAEAALLLSTRVASRRPFAERWMAFWSNHLCISLASKGRLAPHAGAYEREAIRPHAFGRFETMLLASVRHPAMLVYLDNAQSAGPGSLVARRGGGRRGRPTGLNENHAREILELHTLGVDGGYRQEDVEQLARILTGWSVDGVGRRARGDAVPTFRFVPAMHEPGPKRVLGTRYGEAGEEEGVAVLRDLARRPATARHLAAKLARHFLADDPPAGAVEALAARWRATEGDLREVARTLVTLDRSWDPGLRKFRSPQDWLVATLRAVGLEAAPPPAGPLLRQLRHQLWAPPAPAGYGDRLADWGDPDALMNRAELARSLAARLPSGARLPAPAALARVMTLADGDPLRDLLGDDAIPAAERHALAFAGPAFQWR